MWEASIVGLSCGKPSLVVIRGLVTRVVHVVVQESHPRGRCLLFLLCGARGVVPFGGEGGEGGGLRVLAGGCRGPWHSGKELVLPAEHSQLRYEERKEGCRHGVPLVY